MAASSTSASYVPAFSNDGSTSLVDSTGTASTLCPVFPLTSSLNASAMNPNCCPLDSITGQLIRCVVYPAAVGSPMMGPKSFSLNVSTSESHALMHPGPTSNATGAFATGCAGSYRLSQLQS